MKRKKVKVILLAFIITFGLAAAFQALFSDSIIILKQTYSNVDLGQGLVDEIVLVNIGDADRKEIAKLIQEISQYEPSVIGINVLFDSKKSPEFDLTLRKALENAPSVLLAKHGGLGLYGAHQDFIHSSNAVGFNDLVNDGEFTSHFYLFRDHLEQRDSSFALLISSHYSSDAASVYLESHIEQPQALYFTATKRNFRIFNWEDHDLSMQDIKGRIVLLGYLGPRNEDQHRTITRFVTANNSEYFDMYATEIMANQILMILNDLPPKLN